MQQNGLLQSRNVPSFIPVQQCLFFDFYTVFSKSESIAQNMVQGSSIRIEGALHLSKRYKAAIKRALKMLDQAEYNEGQSQVALQELGEELCSAELLWSLIEAVSIRPSHNLLVIDLLEWTRECFPSTQSQIPSSQEGMMANSSFLGPIMDELMQQERPELHESYWNAVIRQSLCADFPTVATLLQFHSAFKNDQALAKMVKILLAANSDLFKSDRSNCDEFIKLQKKVRDLVARKELFRAHDNLGVICSLLIGDKGTFKKYFDLYRPNWFEVFPAFILFFYPNADGRQMPKIAENYFSLLGLDRRQLSKIEKTVLAIFELDLIQALRLICSAGQSTCWFATHLVDLLHFHDPTFLGASNDQFQIYTTTKSTNQPEIEDLSKLNLRSRLLIEFGQLLFADAQLWEIGSEYLLASGIQNAQKMLDRIIGELNWHGNGTMAEKLIQICERFELQNAKETILKEITMKFCRQFEWSSALNWALRMENNDLAVQVARQILQGAIPAARIGQMRIFESMAEQFVSAAELVLLYKFYTFRRRLFDGELRQAIQLLHELFLDNSSPIEFHVVLCEEMLRILATFQRPLVGPDAIAEPINAIPGLGRDSVQDMFRALSKLQLQQNLLKAATTGEKELQENALFPNGERNMPEMKVYERLLDLMQTLRPMLAEALAACSLY